ncbi:MAG: DUF5357 family protein [Phormidesmis sp.]
MGLVQEGFRDISRQARELFLPKHYFSWQTLLFLSLFSILMAAALESTEEGSIFAVRLLSNLSWIFLTSAIWWALHKNPVRVGGFSISPWITGAVLCFFLFRPWMDDDRLRWAISSWPMVGVVIMALPDFVEWDLQFHLPNSREQQRLIMTTLINLLLTSWILFHFRVQDWVTNYPSLLVNALGNSAFVSDFSGSERQRQSQGGLLLEGMADAIKGELDDQPWYQTERWLYTRQNRLEGISQRMLATLDAPDEKIFWRLAVPEPRRLGDGYALTLRANWLGPVADGEGFYLEKTCKIMPVARARSVPGQPARPSSGAAAEDRPQATSQATAVTCPEDPPEVEWVKADT